MPQHLCIVSPHLDDAVLSCGIAMQRAKARGDRVTMLNIFNAGTNAANRRIEDENAARVLGVEAHFLNELDAPDRDARYKSEIELFFGDFAQVPDSFVTHIAKRLEDFFKAEKVDEAFFPLAAGGHIDHRIAHAAGRRITSVRVRYYEDRPYILWAGVLQGRMNQIGASTDLPVVTAQQMQATLHDYHYLKHFVPAGAYQKHCLPLYYAALQPPAQFVLKALPETLTATQDELRAVYAALACYTSQMPFIYPDEDNFITDSRHYQQAMTGGNDYIERSWVLKG